MVNKAPKAFRGRLDPQAIRARSVPLGRQGLEPLVLPVHRGHRVARVSLALLAPRDRRGHKGQLA